MKHVTNKGGVTHQVNDDHAKLLLDGSEGFRLATDEEIAECDKRYGLVLPTKKPGEEDAAYLNRLKYGQLVKVATEGGVEVDEDMPRDELTTRILDEIARKAALAKEAIARESGK